MSVNKVILLGRLGRDPEVKTTNSGSFCTFSIATSEKWTDKVSGEKKEMTEWHNCVAFGKIAELIHNYVHKGSQVYIEGSLRTTKKDDKYFTNINVMSIQFLDGKKDSGDSETKQNYSTPSPKNDFYTADDIPF